MKTANKLKTESTPSKAKAVKGGRRSTRKSADSNGKNPPATYEHAPIGIVETSLDGRHMNVNEEFCRIVGYQKEELLGRPIKDFTHEEDYPIDVKLHEQLVEGKIPFYRLEKRYLRKDGSHIWVELTRSIVRDEDRNPLYTIGVVLDISERKHVERVLRESVERLRLATEAARMFTWGWDFQNQSYTLSDSFTQVLGFPTDLLSKNSFETLARFIPADDLQSITAAFLKAVENRKDLHSLQCRVIDAASGQVVWLEISAKIVYDYEGKPERMFGVAQNITEDKQKEEALSESEERFRALVSQATAGIAQSDLGGRFTFVNPRFGEMLGYPASELVGKTIWELTYTDDLPENERLFKRMLEQGESYQFEKRFLRKDGIPLWTSVSVSAIRDRAGKPKGGVGVMIDIQERKQAEEALSEFARQQEALYKLADQLHRTESLEDVFNAALDAILNALQCDRASILLFDHTDVMRFVAWRGLSDAYRKTTEGHSPWKADAKNPEPLSIDDIKNSALSEELKTVIEGEGIGSLAFIPLVSNGKLMGKFMVYFDRPHTFDASELDLSLTIAHQLAFGIDRKYAEENLRQSEERYRGIVNQTIGGIAETDLTGRFTMVNDRYCEITGYTREKLLNEMRMQDITHPDDLPKNHELFGRLAGDGDSFEIEKRYVRPDGSMVWVHNSVSAIVDAEGKPQSAVAVVIDVTERKRIEEALRMENERFMRFVNSNIVGILIGNANGDVILANDYYLSLLGVTREEFMNGKVDWKKFTPPEWLPADENAIRELHERGVCEPYEKEYMRADGTRVPVYVADALLSGPGEEIAAFVLDISERKRAEEALRRNEKMFSTLVDAAPFGVYFIDSEFRLRAINKGSESVFRGISPLIGRDFAEILRIVWKEPFATQTIDRFRHTLRTGESFLSPPVVEERANIDDIQAYDWQIHRITLSDGTYGVVCYFYDLSEQKKMEASVRASETLYRTIARSIPGGGVYVVDKDFRYLIAEGPVTEAFGLSREMIEGRTVSEVFPNEQGARMEERLRRNFDGETVSFETTFNGRVYWTQQAPLLDSIGQAIILTLDITERKKAEEALRESEERLSAILRQATAGIVRKDNEGRLIFVNQAFCNRLGYTESDLLGKTIWEFMHPDDIEENKNSYKRLMAEGIPSKLERRLLREDGSVIWMDASVSPIMDATGKPQSAVAVEVDITGRKRAEEALRELNLQLEDRVLSRTAKLREVNQTLREEIAERKRIEEALRQSEAAARSNEEKLHTLFDLLPVGISFLDPQGQIIQMNSALPNILKLSKEQLLSQAYTARKYIRSDGRPMLPNEFASSRALAEDRTIYNVETGTILENGEIIWTNVSAAPVKVANVGAVVVTVDITDGKRAERALQESHRRLRILSQRLVEVQEDERRALARELHDRVGQTLAALNINLIIVNSQLSGEAAEQIGTRLNDSMKLVAETIALVRDVMTDLRPSILDDYGLEAALESHLAQFISRYNISARLEKPAQPLPRLGPSIEMTFLRIAQEALLNIARHAKASEVRLSLRPDGDMICLTIQDNGMGIESWQHANRPGSHGLTIMRERAEAFAGTLQVKSVPGEGTIVDVTIPFTGEAPAESREKKNT